MTGKPAPPCNFPKPLFIGIDLGTSGCRASAINSTGKQQAWVEARLAEPVDIEGHQAQQPSLWWRAVAEALDSLLSQVNRKRIAAIAVDGTSGTILALDEHDQPLGPALMYNDTANIQEAGRIREIAPADCAAQGASSGLAKWLYLQDRYGDKMARCLTQADWISAQLSGRFDISDENNCLKLGYDPIKRHWPEWLSRLGIDSAGLPRVLPPGTRYAAIAESAAQRFNLPAETQVVTGTTDSIAATIATGISEVGEAVTSLGSTLAIKMISDKPVFAPEYGIYSHRLEDRWLVGGASNSGGAVLRHYFSDQQMTEMTARVNPEQTTGLDYYPLLRPGERFPINDPLLAPKISPQPEDPVVFFQALLEGIAAIEAKAYQGLHELGAPYPSRVFSVGGGATNPAWMEIRRQRLGVEIYRAEHTEAAYGAALLARQAYIKEMHGHEYQQ